jgi:hypothetical protein
MNRHCVRKCHVSTIRNAKQSVSGFYIGMGDKLDPQKGLLLRAGGFAEGPAKMNLYTWSTSETVVQAHGQGPFAITYVNPGDDPRK